MTDVLVSTTNTVINVTVETYNTTVTPEVVSSTIIVQATTPESVTVVHEAQQGPPGPPNVLEIGTVTTLAPGEAATASITGTTPTQTLNLGIPAGETGAKGDTGPGVPVAGNVGDILIKTGPLVTDTVFGVPEISQINGLQTNLSDKDKRIANSLSTTILTGLRISFTPGGTTVDISSGAALFVDNTDPSNPTYTTVTYPGASGLTPDFLITGTGTFFYLTLAGDLDQRGSVDFYNNTKDICAIGWVAHYDETINYGRNEQYVATDLASQLHNFWEALGAFNISGNSFSGNADLTLIRSAGVIFDAGTGVDIDPSDPNRYPTNSISPVPMNYTYSDGAGDWNYPATSNNIDPNYYDDMSGTLAAVPAGKFTIQDLYMYLGDSHDIQYGQKVYNTMNDAESGLGDSRTVNPDVAFNILRARIILKQGATDLSDPTQAKFFTIDRFGGVSSSGGGGGEINTASNLGTEGYGVWHDKLGVDLRFNNLVSKDELLGLTANGTNHTIEFRIKCMFNMIAANLRSYDYSWTVNGDGLADVFTYVVPSVGTITKTITYVAGSPTKITLAGTGLPTLTNKVKNLTLNVDGTGSVTYTPT